MEALLASAQRSNADKYAVAPIGGGGAHGGKHGGKHGTADQQGPTRDGMRTD
jgi:hypothetical protein